MNGNILYPGADDNASGVAAMIEIAEEFAHAEKLNYNIIFLATTAEEEGLLGSRFFVNDTLIKPAKIIFNINIDMLGRTDENHRHNESYIYSIGTDQNRKIASLFASADSYFDKANYDYSLDNSNDLAGLYHRADQYNFYSAGIPAVFLTSGLHDDYHKPTDKASSINFSLLENRAKLVYLSLNLIQSGNQSYSDKNFNNKAE